MQRPATSEYHDAWEMKPPHIIKDDSIFHKCPQDPPYHTTISYFDFLKAHGEISSYILFYDTQYMYVQYSINSFLEEATSQVAILHPL